MDDFLIENDEIQGQFSSTSKESPLGANKKGTRRFLELEETKNLSTLNVSDTTPIKLCDTRMGMMYTYPITIDSPELNVASAALPPLIYKFTNGDFTDNIKCIATTILFLGVIVLIIVVAIYKNPEM